MTIFNLVASEIIPKTIGATTGGNGEFFQQDS